MRGCHVCVLVQSDHHNETGFITPTPFTDTVDVLLADCAFDILARYPVVFLATPIISSALETTRKLERYVKGGGKLVVTADALATLPGLLDTTVGSCTEVPAGWVAAGVHGEPEKYPTKACEVRGPGLAAITTTGNGTAMAYSSGSAFAGSLVVLATSGMASTDMTGPLSAADVEDAVHALKNPFPMATHVRNILTSAMVEHAPFTAGPPDAPLSVVVNRVGAKEYLVAVANTELQAVEFKLAANPRLGTVESVLEIALPDAELAASGYGDDPGYAPTGYDHVDRGASTPTKIAGIDQRIFRVKLETESATLLATVPPASVPQRVALPLPEIADLRHAIALRPTFGQHFDGAVLDWRYVEQRTSEELAAQGRWAFMRNVSLLVDFSSGLNLYPDLRLCNNSVQYEQSIERIAAVLAKMGTRVNASSLTAGQTFASTAIISEHRHPENGRSYFHSNGTETTQMCTGDTRRAWKRLARQFDTIELHLQVGETGRMVDNLGAAAIALTEIMEPNVKLAVHVAKLVEDQVKEETLAAICSVGSLFAAATSIDPYSTSSTLTHHAPLATMSKGNGTDTWARFAALLKVGRGGNGSDSNCGGAGAVPWVVVDASLPNMFEGFGVVEDAEFAEVAEIEEMLLGK
eukprot:SAG11_NODE_194_length_12858_cov_28.436946_1_plen_637_part_00